MINLKPQIYKSLTETSADDVSYFYPETWVKGKKLISYYELDNSEAENADDEEYSSNIAIQVDIWCDTPSECSSLAIEDCFSGYLMDICLKRLYYIFYTAHTYLCPHDFFKIINNI